jgi:hypothetical protein
MYTARDVQRLAQAANYPDYEDKNLLFKYQTVAKRRETIRSSAELQDREVAAAIELQRTWRGYRARKILCSLLSQSSASLSYLSSNCTSPTYQEIRESLNSSPNSFRVHSRVYSNLSKGISRIQSSYATYTEEQNTEEKRRKLLSFQGFSARTIQTWWRHVDKKLRRIKETTDNNNNDSSNNNIGGSIPSGESNSSNVSGIRRRVKPLTTADAAISIQKAWRTHIVS